MHPSAYRNDRTLSELSAEYGVSSMQIGRWKKTLSDRASELEEELSVAERRSFIDPCDTEMSDSKSVRAFGIEPLRLLPIIVAL